MTKFEPGTHFPRAAGSTSWWPLLDLHGQLPEALMENTFDLRKAEFHPAGDIQATEQQLQAWREGLNQWAYEHRFPGQLNDERRSEWDVELGLRFQEDTKGLSEAFHPDVWCWLAVHLLPHLVVYRWGWPAASDGQPPTGRAAWARFGTSLQNGLRLALHRVVTYGPEIARRASEQEFQSIQNRPAYGRDQRVARAVLRTLVDAAEDGSSVYGKGGGGGRALDADRVCTELRLINSLQPFCFAKDEEIVDTVMGVIERLPELRNVHRPTAPLEPSSTPPSP